MAEGPDRHFLAKEKHGGELLGALSERLPVLRAINAIQPDLFGFASVQN
jgi:hypothetical protein